MHILDPTKHWHCPACEAVHVTKEPRPHIPMHPCPKLGIIAPFVEDGVKARLVAVEREDYIGTDLVRYAHGRPVMSIRTERADGSNDTHVFAPTATADTQVNN